MKLSKKFSCVAIVVALGATTLAIASGITTSGLIFPHEQQSNNFSFEDGTNSWTSLTADFFSIHQIEQRGWVPSVGDRELEAEQSFLRVTGQGDIGQFVGINGKSPYQVLSCLAFKQSDDGSSPDEWSGFGVTYYDAFGNELEVQQKEIGPAFGSANRGYADGMVPYAIGLVVPQNAVFAYIWVWNGDAAIDTYVDNFELVNYFDDGRYDIDQSQPPGDRYQWVPRTRANLILNGSFSNQFGNDEFWQIDEVFDTVYPYSRFGSIDSGKFSALIMGGTFNANLIYQFVGGVQPGIAYDLTALYRRPIVSGQGDPPFAIAGIDYFDAGGTKIADATIVMQDVQPDFTITERRSSVSTTPPPNTAFGYAWVWVAPSGTSIEAPLELVSFSLREENTTPPTIAFSDFPPTIDGRRVFAVTVDQPNLRGGDCNPEGSDGDFTVSGVNGFSTCTYLGTRSGNPFLPTAYIYQLDQTLAPGTYSFNLQANKLANSSGYSAPAQTITTYVED